MTQPFAQVLAHFRIERAERLIEEQHARLNGQCARQGHALALPAGNLRRQPLFITLELDQLEQLSHSRGHRGAVGPFPARQHAQAEGDILEDVHVLEERVMLEDKPGAAFVGALARDFLVAEGNPARVGNFEAGNNAQERGLAAAARAKQGEQFAGAHLKGDILERHEIVELLGNVIDGDAHGWNKK